MATAMQDVEQALGTQFRKANIFDNAVIIRLSFGRFGITRSVDAARIEVIDPETGTVDDKAKKERLKTTKKILECPEYEAIKSLDGEIWSYLKTQCVPSFLADGMYMLNLKSAEKVDARLKQYSIQRSDLVDIFCDALEQIINRDRDDLGSLMDETEYASVAKVKAKFTMAWDYLKITTPRSLASVSEEFYAEAKNRMEANVQTATDAMQELLRAQFAKFVSHLVDKLTPGEDGKKKRFYDSSVDNFKEFLNEFRNRDITDDYILKDLVIQAERLLDGVEPDQLRRDDFLKDGLKTEFAKIETLTDAMIQQSPGRRFSLKYE